MPDPWLQIAGAIILALLSAVGGWVSAGTGLRKSGPEIRKMDAETDTLVQQQIHTLWLDVRALQAENMEFRTQLQVRDTRIGDLEFELQQTKRREGEAARLKEEEHATFTRKLLEIQSELDLCRKARMDYEIMKAGGAV